jgi:hypothetical protein
MKKILAISLAGVFILVLGAGIVFAQPSEGSSPNYSIPWDVVSGGGNEMASANFAIKSTTGQTTIGPGSSSSYSIGAGYWTGLTQRAYEIFLPLSLKSLMP